MFKYKKTIFGRDVFWLLVIALIVGVAMTGYLYHLNLLRVLLDESAHMLIARWMLESLTPGISQLGFWQPLVHIVLLPTAWVPFLFRTGLAGSISLMPFFIGSEYFLYKIVFRLSQSKMLAWFVCILFLLNPYILYYASVPMQEMLFIFFLLATSYFFIQWMEEGRLIQLVSMGFCVSLSYLSRYEGLVEPIFVGILVLIHLWRQKKSLPEIEATLIIFFAVCSTGLIFLLWYGSFFSGNPLTFLSLGVTRDTATLPIIGDTRPPIPWPSIGMLMLHALYFLFGKSMVLIAAISSVLVMFFTRKKMQLSSLVIIMICPFILLAYLLRVRNNNIIVADLPTYASAPFVPIGKFANTRYMISLAGIIMLFPSFLYYQIHQYVERRWPGRTILSLISLAVMILLLGVNLSFFIQTVRGGFEVIRKDISFWENKPTNDTPPAVFLESHYDGGKVLMMRKENELLMARSKIPLRTFINEGNYLYVQQAVAEPWLFIRWVFVNDQSYSVREQRMLANTEKTEEFKSLYEKMFEISGFRIYKIREEEIKRYAKEMGYDTSKMPSLHPTMDSWDPESILSAIKEVK